MVYSYNMKIIDGKKVYTVSEVNYIAKQTLEQMPFWVEGEVCEFKKNPNWSFFYLKIKDDRAILPCIANGYLLDGLDETLMGQKILISGNLTLYEANGQYQLRISTINLAGEGAIARKLEELIKKLKAEGLFEQKYKKQIPLYPKNVCLITSEGSDAQNDFITHSVNKFPIIELFTADVRVQGQKAISEVLKVLPKIDKMGFDVIVLTRGGGSLEDLAVFNDEKVARAIFGLTTPIIVAIGHEANESLAEWVADKRASTPTDAANIVTEGYVKVLDSLIYLNNRLKQESDYYFSNNLQKLDHYFFRLTQMRNAFKDLPHRLNSASSLLQKHEKLLIGNGELKCDQLFKDLMKNFMNIKDEKVRQLSQAQRSLTMLSPQNTLSRGYSITYSSTGNVLRSIKDIELKSVIKVKLHDGSFRSQVKSKQKNG